MRTPIVLVLVPLLAGGCHGIITGSDHVKIEQRPVSDFTEVALEGSAELVLDITGTESLLVEADDNLIPLLRSEVIGHRLRLFTDDKRWIQSNHPLRYRVTAATLDRITLAGSGTVDALGLDSPALDASVEGSGEMTLAGTADTLALSVAGSGTIQSRALTAGDATVTVEGSGAIALHATRSLLAHVTGSGSIRYLGHPVLTTSIEGSGEIEPAQ